MRGGGRPAVAVRLRRTSRPSAVSSSFVNSPTRSTDETARRAPHHPYTTRDPGQDLQSLPLLYAMHVTLPTPGAWCAWFVCRVMLVCCALCAQVRRRVSRAEERRGRWTLTGPTCFSVFLPACVSGRIPKWASQTRFVNSTAGETGLRNSPQRAGIACLIMSASSALSVHLLSPFGASHLITALRP